MTQAFDPYQILAARQRELGEAWEAYRRKRDARTLTEREGLEDARQRYAAALRAYQLARLDYFPFSESARITRPPVARAAYSDRMAWLMANMSNLAYIRFDYGFEPDEQARSQRQQNGLEQLKFSLQSGLYNPGTDATPTTPDPGAAFELLQIFDTSQHGVSDTQAFLARSDSFAVLAFRGTEPDKLKDILTDIDAVLHSTREGDVHLGFLDAYNEVKAAIRAALPAIGDLPLYITGHSLGAALATIAVQDLSEDKTYRDQLAACYTFGSPRLGDGTYEGHVKVPVYRMAYFADIVTLVPLFFWIYVHIGDPRYISPASQGRLIYRGMPTWTRFWQILAGMFQTLFSGRNPLLLFAESHAIVNYIDKLKNIATHRNTI